MDERILDGFGKIVDDSRFDLLSPQVWDMLTLGAGLDGDFSPENRLSHLVRLIESGRLSIRDGKVFVKDREAASAWEEELRDPLCKVQAKPEP